MKRYTGNEKYKYFKSDWNTANTLQRPLTTTGLLTSDRYAQSRDLSRCRSAVR